MNLRKTKKGFTIVELIVVLTIISLIAIMVIPNYMDAHGKAMGTTCVSNQRMIYTAAALFINIEAESLEDMGHQERLESLVEKDYVRGYSLCECPSSGDGDNDDYTLVFEDGYISDVECDVKPAEHEWKW